MPDVPVDTDKTMREMVAGMPVPEFEKTAFVVPKPLFESRVAIVTSADDAVCNSRFRMLEFGSSTFGQ